MAPDFQKPVLLVIDMQNDFVRKGAPMEVRTALATIPAITTLLQRFRKKKLSIIYTRYVADPLYHPLAARLNWIQLTKAPVEACVINKKRYYNDIGEERFGVDIIDELAAEPEDIIIDKIYYNSFFRTDLETILDGINPSCMVIAGTVTEMCVEDTARHAVHCGYQTIIVADAVSSGNEAIAQAALHAFEHNYGFVLSTKDILAQLP